MASYVKGNLLNIFYHNGTSWVPFAHSTSNSMSMSQETAQISSKDLGKHPDTEVTSSSWNFSTECYYTPANGAVASAMADAGKAYTFCFAQCSQSNYADGLVSATGVGSTSNWTPGTTFCKYGNAIVTSLNINAGDGETATMSIEFAGSGALKDSQPSSIESYTSGAGASAHSLDD